jgi:hypothetical protein
MASSQPATTIVGASDNSVQSAPSPSNPSPSGSPRCQTHNNANKKSVMTMLKENPAFQIRPLFDFTHNLNVGFHPDLYVLVVLGLLGIIKFFKEKCEN